jgi:two-component system response regulator YesN
MYKVILVDDEKQIIEGLTAIINWQKYNCMVVGAAYNGKMGIEQALLLKPDIIVTDIRMPHIEGIEMVAKIQENQPNIKFIILSGFSEFNYAKKGMELGVKHYVLKPVEEIELEASIELVVSELNTEKKQRAKLEEYKELSSSGKLLQQEHLMRDLLNTNKENEDILEALEDHGIVLDYPYVTCMIAKMENIKLKPRTNTFTIYHSKDYTLISFRYSHREYAVMMVHAWKGGLNFHEAIRAIQSSLSDTLNSSVILAIGSTYSSLRHIGQSFEEARRAIGYMMLGKKEDILFFDQLQYSDSMINLPQEMLQKLDSAVEQMNTEACSSTIEQILNSLKDSEQLRQIDLRIQCLNLYLITASKMTPMQVQQLNYLVGENIMSLEVKTTIWTLNMCKDWMNTLFQSIIELKKQHQPNTNRNVVDEVKAYLDNNFAENLTLFSIAERFYISPNYLSQLFRKKTGDTFLGYLTKVRVEKAKYLLLHEEAKIYEICNQIGYEDPKYFRKVFEKIVGIKPSEYRSLNKN